MTDPAALEKAREFINFYWGDEGEIAAIRRDIGLGIARHRPSVEEGLAAMEAVLEDPPGGDTLLQLVTWDANYALDSGTEEEAEGWMRDFARLVREELDAAG